MTRASSSTQDSEPLATPDETFAARGYNGGTPGRKLSSSHDAVHIRSNTPEAMQYRLRGPRLEALPEVEYEPEPYGPYFSLPRDPTAGSSGLSRRKTAKELIGRYESMSDRSDARTAVSTSSGKSGSQRMSRPGAYPAIEKKDKGRSPIRQSIRNILSVFKKSRGPARDHTDTHSTLDSGYGRGDTSHRANSPSRSLSVTPQSTLAIPKETKDLSICSTPLEARHARRSGPLLYLARPANPTVHPVWTNCTATLHSTHVLLTWHTRHGNPSTDIISFKACSDVRSLSVLDLDANERALLPSDAGEAKVFELLFEGRPREKFAAANVTERATWVSAIWDAILQAQEERTEASSIAARENSETQTMQEGSTLKVRPLTDTARCSRLSVETDNESTRSGTSTVSQERALPEIPKTVAPETSAPRLSLQIPSPIRSTPSPSSALSPLPRPPVTPIRQSSHLSPCTQSRSQSPSIRDLDQRSMVKQRLAQIESASSPTSPTRASASSPSSSSPLRASSVTTRSTDSSSQRQNGPLSSTGGSIFDSYGDSSVASPLSAYSGRLTSVPSTTPRTSVFPWSRDAGMNSALLKPPSQDTTVISPASKYSTDDASDNVQSSPVKDNSQDSPQQAKEVKQPAARRPIIRLDTDASSLKPPMIWRQEPRVNLQEGSNVNFRQEQGISQQHSRLAAMLLDMPSTGNDLSAPEELRDESLDPLLQEGAQIGLRHALECIGSSVRKLEGRSGTDGVTMMDIRSKVETILEEIRRQPGTIGLEGSDISLVLRKLEEMRSELKGSDMTVSRNLGSSSTGDPSFGWSEMHAKVDKLATLCHDMQGSSVGNAPGSVVRAGQDQQVEEILSLLRSSQSQWSAQTEQQTDSIRYLNELNSWLEAFVNHGISQIEGVSSGVQQLCKDLGSVPELQEQGEQQGGGSLLADVRKLLVENRGREENSVALHASVNGLIAAVQEDLKKNSEARNLLTTESVVGLIDRQRQDHERMLRTLGTELSNEIRGERLRFVEAMKEATAINVQIHVEEFKKDLTREVLLMTQEVGRLQRERQGLEGQIADLFAFYAKQKQAGGLAASTRQNMHNQPRPQVGQIMPGGFSQTPTRRRPLPSPTVAPRPASSFA